MDEQAAKTLAITGQFDQVHAMIVVLATAVQAADLYLNNFDVSPPSRKKAETRALVEEAMALLRPQEPLPNA